MMDEINLNGASNGGNNNSDDEVVIGADEELAESKNSVNGTSSLSNDFFSGLTDSNSMNGGALNFRFEASDNEDLFGDRPLPDWVDGLDHLTCNLLVQARILS